MKDLDPAKRSQVEGNLLKQAQEFSLSKDAFSSETQDGILDKIDQWTEKTLLSRLPLQVETIKIYPQNMPLTTLQFTERLGYKKENAIQMLAMGCYSTLDSLRTRLEKKGWESLDAHDRRALDLQRHLLRQDLRRRRGGGRLLLLGSQQPPAATAAPASPQQHGWQQQAADGTSTPTKRPGTR